MPSHCVRFLGRTVMLLATGVLCAFGSPAGAQTETHVLPGKLSAFASTTDQTVLPSWGPTPQLTTTIRRGKRKRALKIDAMLTIRDSGTVIPGLLPTVNGFGDVIHPFARAIDTCQGVTACAASGSWYVDLDEAEALHPDSFIGKPLQVDLVVGEIAGGPDAVPWDASLTVLMVKK
jgi:hypothetical protein